MDATLNKKFNELSAKSSRLQTAASSLFADTRGSPGGAATPLGLLHELRAAARRAMHTLQPADYDVRTELRSDEARPTLQLVGAAPRPLSATERADTAFVSDMPASSSSFAA